MKPFFHPGLAVALATSLSIPDGVRAEGVLVGSKPGDNEVLSSFDGTVKLWFTGNVSERFPALVVVDSSGARVDNADATLTIAERSELRATTRSLSSGSYVVRYRVVTEDGLVISGIHHFAVGS